MADVQVGTLPQPCQILAPGYQSLRTVTYQGVAWLAVLVITWPVLETSWPAPATVWHAPRSGAIPKNASRTRLESAILLHMTFTLLSGFGAGHAKPLVFDAGCWGSGAPGTSNQPTAFEDGRCRRCRFISFLRETDPANHTRIGPRFQFTSGAGQRVPAARSVRAPPGRFLFI
jgi:hypothetical protein